MHTRSIPQLPKVNHGVHYDEVRCKDSCQLQGKEHSTGCCYLGMGRATEQPKHVATRSVLH